METDLDDMGSGVGFWGRLFHLRQLIDRRFVVARYACLAGVHLAQRDEGASLESTTDAEVASRHSAITVSVRVCPPQALLEAIMVGIGAGAHTYVGVGRCEKLDGFLGVASKHLEHHND